MVDYKLTASEVAARRLQLIPASATGDGREREVRYSQALVAAYTSVLDESLTGAKSVFDGQTHLSRPLISVMVGYCLDEYEYDGMLCSDGLWSLRFEKACECKFINRCLNPIELLWIDYNGAEIVYAVLETGEVHHQPTYTTHPWIARYFSARTTQEIEEHPTNAFDFSDAYDLVVHSQYPKVARASAINAMRKYEADTGGIPFRPERSTAVLPPPLRPRRVCLSGQFVHFPSPDGTSEKPALVTIEPFDVAYDKAKSDAAAELAAAENAKSKANAEAEARSQSTAVSAAPPPPPATNKPALK